MIAEALTEEECYLAAILQDTSGIDLAEFCMPHPENEKTYGIFRCWPFQYPWWRNEAMRHVDAAARLVGKALDVDTPIMTIDGWKTFGELTEEDIIFAPDGSPTAIETAFDVMLDRPCFEVDFGVEKIVADVEHQWSVSVGGYPPEVLQTIEIKELFMAGNRITVTPNHKGKEFEIVNVRMVESRPVRCIEVEHESKLFLVGKNFIPTHNTMSISVRALAFPFNYPDQEMMITGPEQVHVQRVIDDIKLAYAKVHLAEEMLSAPFTNKPFKGFFINGGRMYSRIPQRDGSALQGAHPTILEMDEGGKFPERGWSEIKNTLKSSLPQARFRCFAEDQLILTMDGWVPISDVKVGTMVLTHKNRWRQVLNVFDNGTQECVSFKGHGMDSLIGTPGHKFWSKTRTNKKKHTYTEPSFNTVSDSGEDFWCFANGAYEGSREFPKMERVGWKKNMVDLQNEDWLWLYGLFIAEGYTVDFQNDGRRRRRAYWCLHKDEVPEVLERLARVGFSNPYCSTVENCTKVCVYNANLCEWLDTWVPKGAKNKDIAPWVFDLSESERQAVFNGLVYGDGHSRMRGVTMHHEYATVSKKLARSFALLARSLGYSVSVKLSSPRKKASFIDDREIVSSPVYAVNVTLLEDQFAPEAHSDEHGLWTKIKDTTPVGERRVYDLEVEEDHSYCIEGVFVSNCHGVPFGAAGTFPDLLAGRNANWTVTRLPAMITPIWNDELKAEKIAEHNGYNTSDYRRNELGLVSDAGSPIFSIRKLMGCVDQTLVSDYNEEEYYLKEIEEGTLADAEERYGQTIEFLLRDIPASHRSYKHVWIGIDFGWSQSPSSICVFAEVPYYYDDKGNEIKNKNGSVLKLISRILLHKITAPDQGRVIKHLMDFYRPVVLAGDITGAGNPVHQYLQDEFKRNPEMEWMRNRLKDCNFSSKVIASFDESIEYDENDPEGYLDAAVMRPFIEASTDSLRTLVNANRVQLPWDLDLIYELENADLKSTEIGKTLDEYGRSGRKKGLHNLDAMRMAAFSYDTHWIDYMQKEREEVWEPPPMMFF